MARKTTRSKAKTSKEVDAKAKPDQKADEAANAGADAAPAPDAKADATAPQPAPADDSKVPAAATPTDAGADVEGQAIAAAAPAQDAKRESGGGGDVTDTSSPEATVSANENSPAQSDPQEGAEGAVVESPAPNSETPELPAEMARALNEAIAGVQERFFDALKDKLCDPALELAVVGPRRGRWRAGRHFGREETVIPAEELKFAEFLQIHRDPLLLVVVRPKTAIAA